jgi:hypothetical protein
MSGSPRSPGWQAASYRAVLGLGLSCLVACSGSGSGGTGGKIKGGFPVDKRVENAVELRVTKNAFDFLAANAKPFIDKLIPPSGIPVPSVCSGDTQICCGQMCALLFDFQNLTFTPQPPATLGMAIRAKLKTSTDFQVKAKVGISVSCKLSLDTTKSGKPDVGVALNIVNSADAMTKLTSINIDANSVDIQDLDDGDIALSGDLLCKGLNLFKGVILNTLKDQLKKQLATPLGNLFCQSCMTADDCSSLANQGCSMSKQCMRNNVCMQHLGLEGMVDLSTLTGKAAGTGPALEYYAVAGGYAAVEAAPTAGLSLGMLGGATVTQKNACVPDRPAPSRPMPPPKTPEYSGNTAPNGQAYHVGAGISTLELDTLGYAFYNAGALCQGIGTDQVGMLSSGLLAALIPSLNDLTGGQNSAIKIVIRPQQPPTFTLGKGTFKTDGMGKRVIDDPLMHLNIKDLALDFYVYIDDTYVRFMRQTADVNVPLSLDVDNMAQIVPMIGDLDTAFGNVRVTNSSLLKESPDQLGRLFPSLLPLVSGALGSGIKPIKLPTLGGLSIVPVQITSTADTMGALSYLGLYLAIQLPKMMAPETADPATDSEFPWTPSAAVAPTEPVQTAVELVSLEVPTAAEMAITNPQPRTPKLVLSLRGEHPSGGPIEWQYRLDNGLWHPFDSQRLLTIADSSLRLLGNHEVEVRGRVIGAPETLDPSGARLQFVVTPAAAPAALVVNHDGSVENTASGCSQSQGRGTSRSGLLLLAAAIGLLALRRRGTLRFVPRQTWLVALLGVLGGLVLPACKDDNPVADSADGGGDQGSSSGKPQPYFSKNDEIGKYESAVVNKSTGKLSIAAYDSTFGDLAFTEVNDPQQPLLWYPVDGLPAGDPQSTDGTATRGGYVDPGDDVGRYTSLAFTSAGNPVIAYQDVTNGAVKLAMRNGNGWSLSVIADAKEGAGVGYYNQLVLDAGDVPTVAYMIAGVQDGMGQVTAQLVVATAKSKQPMGPADWTKKVVESVRVSCAGLCGTGKACVYGDAKKDPSNTVCKTPEKTCTPSCKMNTQACIAAMCVDALGAPAANLPQGTGLFAHFVQNASGPQLLFYSRAAGALRLASGSDWKVTTLEGGDGMNDLGRYIGGALADDGTLHVAFSSADGQLYYRSVKAGVMSSRELVDDGSRTVAMSTEQHSVGAGAYLYLNSGKPVIAYQDSTATTLEEATRDTKWSHKTVAPGSMGSRGFYPQAAQISGTWWLLDVVYDRAADALSSVHFSSP